MVERDPKTDHVTVAFIGGGFAGLVTGARLKEAGVDDVRIIEKGGDFGGTWYWNRYPGAQCDTASFVYMPLLEETGHMPTEKYAHAPEILEHCQRIGKQFGLYDNALFHTEVTDLEWDDDRSRVDHPHQPRRRVHRPVPRHGHRPAARAEAPGHPRHRGLPGPLVPHQPLGLRLHRRRPRRARRWTSWPTSGSAIIGTGATSVQCVPHLATACRELYVFQRTPSSVDVRDNRPTDPEWFATIATPGWQQRWLENFTANQTGGMAEEDLVMDGWTDLARRIRSKIMALPPEEFTPEGMMAAFEDSDFEKMEEIRARVDSIVEDPDTAQNLKAWYRQLCKRPCFHDEYLQAFNEPGTHLVDTDGKGVERITETGVVVAGVEYEVDCIIYASGFEVGTEYTRRAGYDMTGRDGVKLSEHWADGMRTKHGIHVHGFPNLFIVQPTQGANLISNVPHNLTEAGKTIAHDRAARRRRRLRRGRGDQGGRGRLDRAAALRPRHGMHRLTPTARPATTTTRASPARPAPSSSSATPPAPWRTSSTSTSGATTATSRASSSASGRYGRRTDDGRGAR